MKIKKIISIILSAIIIFTMTIPAFAVAESSRQSVSATNTVEIPFVSSIFDKISEIISKIYDFIINIIFPEEEPPGENDDEEELPGGNGVSDGKIAITWRYRNSYANWVEETEYYEYGEELKVYSVPEKVREGGLSLTVHYFKGWSPELEETVTNDMTYEAVYATAH